VAPRPIQAALGALWWAVSGCSAEPSQDAAQKKKATEPSYGLALPVKDLPEPLVRPDTFRRGASLGLFVGGQEDEDTVRKPLYTKLLDELVEVGATDVELLVEWTQTDKSAIEIAPSPVRTVDDDLLRWVIDEANQRSLKVFLMPVLDVEDRTAGASRASLTPPDWDRWWWSYRRFVIHYARIAESHKAAMFSVGSELASTESHSERWQDLITLVRKVYQGPLTYSARLADFEAVSFWDALDVVAITGDHSVAPNSSASDAELDQSVASFKKRLHTWAIARNKSYLLTQVGYPAHSHSAAAMQHTQGAAPPDPLFQLRCYRALYRAFAADPRLLGVYAANWFNDGGPEAASYSPRNQPAASVLRHWFKRSRAPEAAASSTATN
jgi:hypothetical protein